MEGEGEAGVVVDVGMILGVMVEEVREMHHWAEAQEAHTGMHSQMTVEEGDVETLGLVETQEVDMAMINRGVVVEAVVGVEEIRMQVL